MTSGPAWLAHIAHRIDQAPGRPARALLEELATADPIQVGWALTEPGLRLLRDLVDAIAGTEGLDDPGRQGLLVLATGVASLRMQRDSVPDLGGLVGLLDSIRPREPAHA
jgi:hypothetical protein